MPETLLPDLHRRTVLKAGLVTGAAYVASSHLAMPHAAARGGGSPPGRLVVVFLRGGQDHLSAVVPYTDADYYDARPTIAIPETAVLDLDGQFGLHPAMSGLHALYQAGRLGVVVAAGNLAGDRSHFLAQDLWEFGDVAVPADGLGWLARHLNASPVADPSPFRGVALGSNVTTSFRGYPALGLGSVQEFGLGGVSGTTSGMEGVFRSSYVGGRLVEQFGQQALAAIEEVSTLSGSNAPDPMAKAFADIAVLLEAGLGLELVTANIGGWDTHNNMGSHANGTMRNLLLELDGLLAGFQADLDVRGQTDVTTVVMTEFGRRVIQNGSGGTDHGFGTAMFVMGGAAVGGVHGTWPGLASGTIAPRFDVPVTTDFRNVLGDVVIDVLGANPSAVFPGHTHSRVGVTS